MKPLWLLDVDGVVNAVNILEDLALLDDRHWQDYQVGFADAEIIRYQILWSPSLMARIRSLVEADMVEVRWLTTWEERAQSRIAPLLGLPRFELAGIRHIATEGQWWWKLPIAQATVSEDRQRPLIWTDDDIPTSRAAMHWAQDRWDVHKGQTALITPHSSIGLTPRHMDQIETFIRRTSEL